MLAHKRCILQKLAKILVELMLLQNFPDRDNDNWMKHTLSYLDKPFVEDAKVVLM